MMKRQCCSHGLRSIDHLECIKADKVGEQHGKPETVMHHAVVVGIRSRVIAMVG